MCMCVCACVHIVCCVLCVAYPSSVCSSLGLLNQSELFRFMLYFFFGLKLSISFLFYNFCWQGYLITHIMQICRMIHNIILYIIILFGVLIRVCTCGIGKKQFCVIFCGLQEPHKSSNRMAPRCQGVSNNYPALYLCLFISTFVCIHYCYIDIKESKRKEKEEEEEEIWTMLYKYKG
ncbi:hypothetical protein F4703DRAFT_1834649 [Phycomyces blakesleeanus]